MQRYLAVAGLMVGGLFIGATSTKAQSAILNLPRVSQHARFAQRIGLTDITIDYSRTLVRGRKIFGGLQGYGQVWRAGADENTIFEVSDPVTIDGQPLPKGAYGLHMIPGEASWVVIFSKNSSSWGSFTYDQAEDALPVCLRSRVVGGGCGYVLWHRCAELDCISGRKRRDPIHDCLRLGRVCARSRGFRR